MVSAVKILVRVEEPRYLSCEDGSVVGNSDLLAFLGRNDLEPEAVGVIGDTLSLHLHFDSVGTEQSLVQWQLSNHAKLLAFRHAAHVVDHIFAQGCLDSLGLNCAIIKPARLHVLEVPVSLVVENLRLVVEECAVTVRQRRNYSKCGHEVNQRYLV